MKSLDYLMSFTQYCYQNPTERFFQALKNWSRIEINKKINFIWWSEDNTLDLEKPPTLKDTFYIE